MSYVAVAKKAVGKAWWKTIVDALIDNQASFNASIELIGGGGILNGSFEFDLDTDTEPDNWTFTDTSGGTHAIEATTFTHGRKSLKMVSTSSGGFVAALSDDFVAIGGTDETVYVKGMVRQSAADLAKIEIVFYDGASTPSPVSTVTAMEEAALPAVDTWYPIRAHADVPTTARFYRVRLIAGDGAADANTFWDGMASSATPFDWVWEFESHSAATTFTTVAVGYPKYALTDNPSSTSILGWDPSSSTFTSNLANFDSAGGYVLVSLDPVGAFQISVSNPIITKAYR